MNLEQIKIAIEIVRRLITILGDVKLSEVSTWLDVQRNAEELRAEGHPAEEAGTPVELPDIEN